MSISSNMLDDFTTLWLGLMQAVGGLAAAGALIFVGFQMLYTKRQVSIMEGEHNLTLRPWIYRDPDPPDPPNPNVGNYTMSMDPDIKEKCIRVPFHNQGRSHSSSMTYSHMFTDINENQLADEELTRIKKDVKDNKYKEIGNRIIVPGTKFGKMFHLAKGPLKRYRSENPDDSEILNKYEDKAEPNFTFYLVILLEYRYGSNGEKAGEYGGILRLDKERQIHKNEDWIREWVE